MAETITEYPKAIRDFLKKLDRQREMSIGLAKHAEVAEMVAHYCPHPANVSVDWVNVKNVDFTCAVTSIEAVVDILRRFGSFGYRQCKEYIEMPEFSKRVYRLARSGMVSQINVDVTFARAKDGGSCRFVQVGEETKTEPVYELQCDGGES